jgi:hypothetical protein
VDQLPRHPCPVCGRRIAATTTSLYATRREGTWIRYVTSAPTTTPQGHPCSGTHALVEPGSSNNL